MLYADLHNDTITEAFHKNVKLYENNLNIDLKSLSAFDKCSLFFSIFLNKERLNNPFKNTMEYIDFYYENINKYSNIIEHTNSFEELQNNLNKNKIASFLSLEGGEALDGNIDNIYFFYEKGIRAITLTWNNKNNLGYGALTKKDIGLTEFGIKAIKEMEKLKILIDVSHLNEAGFKDVCNTSKNIYASHSNSYAITNSLRNLKDYQIKEIKNHHGIIGINFHGFFLSERGFYNFDNIIKHMEHILNIGGEEILAIGSDFDGTNQLIEPFKKVTGVKKLEEKVLNYFGKNLCKKIFFDNYTSFMERTL